MKRIRDLGYTIDINNRHLLRGKENNVTTCVEPQRHHFEFQPFLRCLKCYVKGLIDENCNS